MDYRILALIALLHAACAADKWIASSRNFTIDYDRNIFLKDNQPFQYVSGSVHYFRIPAAYWYDRLLKIKAMGANTIQFYVPWNFHELEEDQFDFSGNRDLSQFLTISRQLDLLVLLRSGPYVCGEWDFGGFPAWLLRKKPNIVLRSSDPDYMAAVTKWYSVLLPVLKPHLYQNNGSIIMIQVENEYGSYYTCDGKYLSTLYDIVRSYMGPEIIIYSTDGNSMGYLVCGSSDRRIFSTVDFGPGSANNPEEAFKDLKKWQPKGPLVNSEYYTGWLDSWGTGHHKTSSKDVVSGLQTMLTYSKSVSVSMYMIHGGTSFGYWNGANCPDYSPQITSYDYDAPISESGDTTSKYMDLRKLLQNLFPNNPLPDVPPNITKTAYGNVTLKQMKDYLPKLLKRDAQTFPFPQTMESLRQYQGYMIYSTNTMALLGQQIVLKFERIGDFAYVFTSNSDYSDITYCGTINRNLKNLTVSIKAQENLLVLTENAGHVNYGKSMFNDVKGIVGNVSANGQVLTTWKHYPIDFTKTDDILSTKLHLLPGHSWQSQQIPTQSGLFSGIFKLSDPIHDTYAVMHGFSKGVLLLNNEIVGRFWNSKGPQQSLYVPATMLQNGFNKIEVFELEGSSGNNAVEFVDKLIFNY